MMEAATAEALRRVDQSKERNRYKSLLAHYQTEQGIVDFVVDILGVPRETLAPYQIDILQALVREKRVAVRAPHGAGKTALASWLILWLMSVFDTDTKVPCTASAWRQLEKFLFPEVRKWAARANWSKIGMEMRLDREIMVLSIKLPSKEAFAVASNNPALIEGAHASVIGFVYDEAKAIPSATWDATEGAFSTAGDDTAGLAFALAISTPGTASGRFYDIHARKQGYEEWYVRHVTLEEAIACGRISREWADKRKLQWGESSPVYQNRVLANFVTDSEDSLIQLSRVEAAHQRWEACGGKGEGEVCYGVDVARYGDDKTVISKVVGDVLEWQDVSSKQDTMQTVGRVIALVGNKVDKIAVDVIGVGAGVVDRLRELGYNVIPVNASESTPLVDTSGELHFLNVRSAGWWMLRDGLDPAHETLLAIPPDNEELTADLTTPRWTYTSRGTIKIEDKEEIRKRLKEETGQARSTDFGDSLWLALYGRTQSRIQLWA